MTTRVLVALKNLIRIAQDWGGSIEIVTQLEYDCLRLCHKEAHREGWSTAYKPPGHALHWPTKRIVVARDSVDPGAVIHEMGHAFLDLGSPHNSDEMGWLGWEICLAKKAGCYQIWSRQNQGYCVELLPSLPYQEWKDLSAREKSMLADDRIRYGKSIGIIDENNNPLTLR